MGRAEDLYQRLVDLGETAIQEFFDNQQSEELFLDFKRSGDDGRGDKLHQNDRNNLAKAISGFGNSSGGVIVWGVDCNDKDKAGDFPKARVLIEHPQRFVTRLEGAISGLALPPHPGVRHLAIASSDDPNAGYVATFIPQNHTVLQTIDKDFYIRAGSNFLKAPYGVLAGLFGRHPQPVIKLVFEHLTNTWEFDEEAQTEVGQELHGPPLANWEFDAHFGIENLGPGLARDIYVSIYYFVPEGPTSISVSVSRSDKNWDKITDHMNEGRTSGDACFVTKAGFRQAPRSRTFAFSLSCRFEPPFESDLAYEVVYGHESSPVMSTSRIVVPKSRLEAAWTSWSSSEKELEDQARFASEAFAFDLLADLSEKLAR